MWSLPGVSYPLYGKMVKEYIYACPLKYTDKWPVSLSISTATKLPRHRRAPAVAMPVELQPKPGVKKPLAVCVHVAYRHIDPARLVEWFELQRLLGVSLVGVYIMSDFSQSAETVFRYVVQARAVCRKQIRTGSLK